MQATDTFSSSRCADNENTNYRLAVLKIATLFSHCFSDKNLETLCREKETILLVCIAKMSVNSKIAAAAELTLKIPLGILVSG